MRYTPKSHLQEAKTHIQIGNKGALQCQENEKESVFIELERLQGYNHTGERKLL